MKTVYTLVSFFGTPLIEVGEKANQILALGWQFEELLPDRWTAKFSKDVDPNVPSASADDEIKDVMGDYWVDP
jgi:hypothetical protein